MGNVGLYSPHIQNVFRMELSPSPLYFVQEIGCTGRFLPPDTINYSYILYSCMENFIYIFNCCMNLDNTYNNEQFCHEEVDNLFDMSIIVALTPKCDYVASEFLFGNPYVENNHASHFSCGIRPYFWKDQLFPSLNMHGEEEAFFNTIHPKRNDGTVIKEMNPWTLDTLVRSILNYPGARLLLLH